MSILIEGMQMPIAGQTIEICESDTGKRYARLTPSFDDWHEITYVPPHGDLIDKDYFLESCLYSEDFDDDKYIVFKNDIDDIPVIIKADDKKRT